MKKLTKIAIKPTKSMKNAGTVRTRTFRTTPIKSSKSELFISFYMEFRLKTSENHPKIIFFTIIILGQYELVLFVLSKINKKIAYFYQINGQ